MQEQNVQAPIADRKCEGGQCRSHMLNTPPSSAPAMDKLISRLTTETVESFGVRDVLQWGSQVRLKAVEEWLATENLWAATGLTPDELPTTALCLNVMALR